MPLKPFSITYIEYEQGDPISLVVSFSQLAPVFIVVGFAALCAFRRELALYFCFLGQLLDVALNQLLKVTIKQPRPFGQS